MTVQNHHKTARVVRERKEFALSLYSNIIPTFRLDVLRNLCGVSVLG
jgi:hypothetical protein